MLVDLVAPYTRISISHLASTLKVETDEIEKLLVQLILDSKINAKIDQVNQIVIRSQEDPLAGRYEAITKWTESINGLLHSIVTIE